MNKEKKFKLFLAVFFFLLSAISFAAAFFLNYNFLYFFIISSSGAVIFVVAEAYLRVQHNIERINSLQTENLAKFFTMKNELEFKLLNFKYDTEEKLKNIIGGQKNTDEKLNKRLDNINLLALSLIRMAEVSWIKERKKSLYELAPDVFDFKTVLYIGACQNRSQLLEEFLSKGYKITILEAFKPNADFWKSLSIVDEVIEGDVRFFDSDKKFDVVFWWHGPEHAKEDELPAILEKLEALSERMLVLACPWGRYEQGPEYGNPFEVHQSFFNEGFFEKLGFKTNYLGRRDVLGSNICAAKRTEKNS